MKKKNLILLLNILLVVILYFLFKYISLLAFLKPAHPEFSDLIKATNKIMLQKSYEDFYRYEEYRPTEYPNSNEKPIVILGCSFAQGISSEKLKDNETISYLLGQKLVEKRPVLNRALWATGIQAMIWQFTSGEIQKLVNKEPELVIYVLINDIERRLYMEACPWHKSAFYKDNQDDSISLIKNPLHYSYLSVLYRDYLFKSKTGNYYKLSDEEKFNFLRKHFLYLKNEVRKQWKDTKFLILYYHDERINEYIKTLEKDGFDVIYLSEITPEGFVQNPKYRVSEFDAHPTKEAWEVIVPNLYKEISNRYNIE